MLCCDFVDMMGGVLVVFVLGLGMSLSLSISGVEVKVFGFVDVGVFEKVLGCKVVMLVIFDDYEVCCLIWNVLYDRCLVIIV